MLYVSQQKKINVIKIPYDSKSQTYTHTMHLIFFFYKSLMTSFFPFLHENTFTCKAKILKEKQACIMAGVHECV
jgi:hypothetical protein